MAPSERLKKYFYCIYMAYKWATYNKIEVKKGGK